MKKLILLSLLIIGKIGTAQTCAPSSKEMAQFQAQKTWQRVSVQDPLGVPPVAGFRDDQNHFHVEDLSRRGEFAAQVTVNPQNKSYDEFFKYCAQSSSRGIRLQAMRSRGENNRYTVSMRFLPNFATFAGQPLSDSGYRETSADVRVTFSDSSVLMRQEWKPDEVKTSLNESLRKQIAAGAQKDPGVITLDLSGYDDVVCDLIQGNAKLTVERHGISWAPLMQQKKIVDIRDLQTIQQTLKSQLLPGVPKEKALFYAGRLTAKLEQDRKTAQYGDKKSFDILRALMNPDLSKAVDMDWQTLNCVSDQLQSYEASTQQHVMELTFKFPSLEELEAAKLKVQ